MLVFTYTIPDCRRAKLKGWYIATFFVAIAWMGLLVELMVEHSIEAFHEALGIDMGPLGLTFVAGGTSFPDFLASMLVAKKGLADMAVSNAFGSNIFDVLLGLGWPWMMQTTIVDPGGTCTVRAVLFAAVWSRSAKTWSGVAVAAVLYIGSMSFLNSSFGLLVGSYFIWLFVLSCVKWNLAPLMGVIMCATCFLYRAPCRKKRWANAGVARTQGGQLLHVGWFAVYVIASARAPLVYLSLPDLRCPSLFCLSSHMFRVFWVGWQIVLAGRSPGRVCGAAEEPSDDGMRSRVGGCMPTQ